MDNKSRDYISALAKTVYIVYAEPFVDGTGWAFELIREKIEALQ